AAAAPSAAQETGALRWPLQFESAGTVEAAATLLGGAGEPRRFETRIEGALLASTVVEAGDSTIVAYRVDEVSVSFRADGVEVPDDAARIADALGRPAFAHVDPAGRIGAVRFDPELGPFQRGMVTFLLSSLQFAVPHAPAGRTWEIEEDEPNGRYVARYTVHDTAAGTHGPLLTIEKRKLRHLTPADAPLDPVAGMAVESSGALTARYDVARRRLVAAEGSESQTITIGGRRLARTETSLRLGTVDEAPADGPALAAALARSAPPSSLVAAEPGPAARAAEARRAIDGATFEATLAELARVEAEAGAPPAALRERLRAFAVLDPSAADSLAGVLARAPADSRALPAIGQALAAAGTEDAHRALGDALRRRLDERPVASLLIALLGSVNPATAAAEAALRELALETSGPGLALDGPDPDLAHAARLALGVLARQVAADSPERAAGIVEDLLAAYGPAPEGEAARRLLLALGNTGSPLAVGPARKHLRDPSPGIRAAAVGALRFVRDPAAESLILGTLAADSAPAVRLEALDALAFRPPTPAVLSARSRAAREDPDPGIRLVAIQSLWSDRAGNPEVEELVRMAADDDPSPEVRRRAAWLVGTTDGVIPVE
ncbi:MAG TPA: HEAT repeat domain-containing protein, partial [Gemmatimonadota bacterium]|nr:HEAT repeat domain-containing protein [Gemmatimonadota bacterium]